MGRALTVLQQILNACLPRVPAAVPLRPSATTDAGGAGGALCRGSVAGRPAASRLGSRRGAAGMGAEALGARLPAADRTVAYAAHAPDSRTKFAKYPPAQGTPQDWCKVLILFNILIECDHKMDSNKSAQLSTRHECTA